MITSTGMAPAGAHSSHNAKGQGAFVHNKWQLLKTIEDIREPIGLKSTSISILRAMISFVKGNQLCGHADDGHICFASNATLAKRAHVSIQTVERHIAKMVKIGLLTRRSSANGKRWARRDRHGRVVLATGLSLLPLAERHAEFIQLSQSYADQQNELALLRDKCAIALAELKTYLNPATVLHDLFNKARNLLRRKADKGALNALLVEISAEISAFDPAKTDKLKDTDPKNEGHKDTDLNQSVEDKKSSRINVTPAHMQDAFPRLNTELRFARSNNECNRMMDSIAQQLQLGDTWYFISQYGPAIRFMILGYLLERIEIIKNPKAYVYSIAMKLSENKLSLESLLRKPKLRSRLLPRIRTS